MGPQTDVQIRFIIILGAKCGWRGQSKCVAASAMVLGSKAGEVINTPRRDATIFIGSNVSQRGWRERRGKGRMALGWVFSILGDAKAPIWLVPANALGNRGRKQARSVRKQNENFVTEGSEVYRNIDHHMQLRTGGHRAGGMRVRVS